MLKEILCISGKSGLFRMIGRTKTAIVVESLASGKRFTATMASKVMSLQDITMYAEEGDVKLEDIFKNIVKYTGGKKVEVTDLRAEMDKALPTWDREKIYDSDLKKLFSWYNILLEKGLLTDATAND